jgi:hypothetical protein
MYNIFQFYTYMDLHNFIMDQKWPWMVIHLHGHGWSVHENDDLTLYMKIDLLEFYTITWSANKFSYYVTWHLTCIS